MKKFLLGVGLTILAFALVFVLALLWHQNKPPIEIRRDPGGITVVLPEDD